MAPRRAALMPAITAKPCVRYYVAAKHDKTLGDVRWRPEVIDEEPIAGCVVPQEEAQ
jgi:hypothetical protein